jgi:hypothetical protein
LLFYIKSSPVLASTRLRQIRLDGARSAKVSGVFFMHELIHPPTVVDKARAGLTKEESARFFGPAPLIAGEDLARYEAMRDQISAAVRPLDFLEEIWVNDIVNLVWETQRLRRLRAALLQASAHEGLNHILQWIVGDHRRLATEWAARKPEYVKAVENTLAKAGLTMETVMAQTLALKINEVECIDRMVAGAEARRNVALREIDRHRAVLGTALRQASNEVLDAEFKEVPTNLTEGEAG